MKKVAVFFGLHLLFFVFIIYSCSKEKKDNSTSQGQIEFSFSTNAFKSALKTTTDSTSSANLSAAVITIADASGKVVQNSVKIDLFNMNGDYISTPLSLVPGSYTLSQFLLLDQYNKVVYASPVKDSPKALTNPLPMPFTVQTNTVTKVVPEVISTVDSQPEDFGYVTFGFDIATTFDFLVGAFIYDATAKNYELTTASITILSNTTLVYSGQLSSIKKDNSGVVVLPYDTIGITNKITLPERYTSYTIVISKPGYATYSQTFTKDALKQYYRSLDKGPLVVILNKSSLSDGLVALYRFHEDVLDYSGNNNDGTAYGTLTPTTDKDSNPASAYNFNGVNSYVEVPDASSLNPTNQITVSAWYKPSSFVGSGNDALIDKPYTSLSDPYYQYHLGVTGDSYWNLPSKFGFSVGVNDTYLGASTPAYFYEVGKWYHIVGTFDGVNIKLYVNSTLVSSLYAPGKMKDYGQDIYIGREGNYNVNYQRYDYLAGNIGEIRIYNRALTQDEVTSLYQQ